VLWLPVLSTLQMIRQGVATSGSPLRINSPRLMTDEPPNRITKTPSFEGEELEESTSDRFRVRDGLVPRKGTSMLLLRQG
jgi:hypothetical protein